jgi:Phosphate-induced protein 1 conserved region/Bacterial Ig-like domain (group 3)
MILGLAIAGAFITPSAAAQQQMVSLRPRPDGMGDRIRSATPNNAAATVTFNTGNQIQYWGGPVMLGTNHVYVIWYGTFDSGTMGILSTLLGSMGGSPYFNINTGYFDSSGNSISNSVSMMASVQNNYSRGKSLRSSDIGGIVSDTLSGGLLPLDSSNGIYMVLTAGDVAVSGFGSQFCGYHSVETFSNSQVHYAFIGNPAPSHLSNCAAQQSKSPNNNPGADAMASTMSHELEETITDPDLDAWYDAGGNEVADKCAWTFGTTYTVANGSIANMNLGGNNYLIQQDWVNASGGFCALSASPGPDFAVWASTNTQPVAAGSSTGSYVATLIPVKGFSGAVSFSFSGLPAGATASAIPPSASGATFQVATMPTVPSGTYNFSMTGTSGAISHPATFTLVVTGSTLLNVTLAEGPIGPEPSHVAQPYTVNFSVTAAGGTPTGQVTVSDGSSTCSADVSVGFCVLTATSPGTKTITVTYPGDSKFAGTSKTASHSVVYGGSLADLASGSGWETTFTLVNLGMASTPVSLNLFGDPGAALNLPFTFPQGANQPLNASTINQSLNANSVLLLDTTGPTSQSLSVGWGDVSATGNVNAYEIFRYNPSGQEAVVPMETRTGAFALLFDNTSLVNTLGTGVALANLGPLAATVPVVINDDTGAQIASGSIQLAAHGHTAFTLSDQYPATVGKRGTVQLAAPPSGQISALGIRANGDSFTTIPAIQSGATGGSMAHIAAGGGWRSIFYVVNLNTVTSNVTLKFFDDSGNPLSLPLTYLQTGVTATAASITQPLAAGATLVLESQGADSQVVLGSAQLSSDNGASGFALFRYDPSGQEATAPLETRNAPAYVLAYENTAPLATGVALANLATQSTTVSLVVRDDSGAVLETTTLTLPANGHSAFVLGTNYPLTAGKRGTVEFDSTAGAQISVLGIRANGNAFTSIPVLTR